MNQAQDDDLMLLWRQGAKPEPDPEEVARLAGRASMKRFDRFVNWRNYLEYAAGVVGVGFFGWLIIRAEKPLDQLQGVTGLLCLGISVGWLWWMQRGIPTLDASAN